MESSGSSSPPEKQTKYEEPEEPEQKVLLFYCEEAKDLANAVAAESDLIEIQSIQWGKCADGFPKTRINNPQAIRGQKVAFLASFSSPEVIFEQMAVIYMLMQCFATAHTLVLPFFPCGTNEEMGGEANVHTEDALLRILSGVGVTIPIELVTYDIQHLGGKDLQFRSHIRPRLQSGFDLLLPRLFRLPEFDRSKDLCKVAIVFPDEGADVAFRRFFKIFPKIVCSKVYKGVHKPTTRLENGDPNGYHVVIVDDLVQSGDTLIECQKILTANGATEVSAFVTHASFINCSWEKFIHKNDGSENAFSHFWVTDSCPAAVKVLKNRAPFEVLSLAESIAIELIHDYAEG